MFKPASNPLILQAVAVFYECTAENNRTLLFGCLSTGPLFNPLLLPKLICAQGQCHHTLGGATAGAQSFWQCPLTESLPTTP